MIRSLLAIVTLGLALVASPAHAAGDDEVTPQQRFELAQRYAKRGYTTKALELYNRIRNFHRDDPVAVEAELAIADLYFRKGEFEQARLAYDDFARLHPRSKRLDYVVFRSSQALFRRAPAASGRDQTSTKQAMASLKSFDVRFPNSEFRDEVEALQRRGNDRLASKELVIARFYARRDAWTATRRRAEGLVRSWPASKHSPEALYLVGRAWHAWGIEEKATEARAALAARAPESAYLDRLDRVLARPAGLPPEEQTFRRPYRVAGMP